MWTVILIIMSYCLGDQAPLDTERSDISYSENVLCKFFRSVQMKICGRFRCFVHLENNMSVEDPVTVSG